MTNCEQIWDDLKAYSDGELPVMARLRVRRHVSQCPACREEIEAMELIRRRLRQTDAAAFTPELKDKILAGIPEGVPPTDDAAPIRNKKKPMMIFGATAAAALCWFIFYPMTQQGLFSKNQEILQRSTVTASAPTVADQMAMKKASPMLVDGYNDKAKSATESNISAGGAAAFSAPAMPIENAVVPKEETRRSLQAESKSLTAGESVRIRARVSDSDSGTGGAGSGRAVASISPELERQVHRDASLTVQVDSAESKSEKVETSLKAEGGYVADSNLNTLDDGTKTATMTLKVPVDKFETFMATLSKLGEVKSKSVSGEDLTERISDEKQGKKVLGEEIEETQNRLKQRKLSKLQEREDRETLRELKTRIAVKQARLDLYKKMATLSNISLTLMEKPKNPLPTPEPNSGFMHELKTTASDAGQAFLQAAKIPFVLLIWIAVYSPVWLILLAGYRYFVVRA